MASPCRPATQGQTTSVLTAAMIAYALGAGITAAAGTRLALQWLLITGFGLHPFQAPPVLGTSGVAAVRCCLTDCTCIGQFARLLPTLVVVAVSQAPSPESNPDSLSTVEAIVGHYPTIHELMVQKFMRSSQTMAWGSTRETTKATLKCLARADVQCRTSLSQPQGTLPEWALILSVSWVQSTTTPVAASSLAGVPAWLTFENVY